jgi:hypothetical protein
VRLLQFTTRDGARHVALVAEDRLCIVEGATSTYELATTAITEGRGLEQIVESCLGSDVRPYDQIIAEGRILPPIDHPDPARLWVTGTGLTHLGGASARHKMHSSAADTALKTDSMKMFEMGLEGGKPAPGSVGAQPEWFYKGNGYSVAAPGGSIASPAFALLDGDEIEICALYLIGPDGTPCRIGFALGNEFADHRMEKINYLYLAHSKLRACSFGPELRTGSLPEDIRGVSRIIRAGRMIWQAPFASGEVSMSHSLANLEHHHFKYGLFRRPGDVHCHFLGTATLSFSEGIEPRPGDIFEMEAEGFGKPLRNVLVKQPEETFRVRQL